MPDNMSFDIGAGFLVAYGTSHLALSHRARLKAGETPVWCWGRLAALG